MTNNDEYAGAVWCAPNLQGNLKVRAANLGYSVYQYHIKNPRNLWKTLFVYSPPN